MDLNKLKTFVHVAELGSVTKAAEQLYRTQPAISNQLRDLERELGFVLFERRNAKIFLTREGEQLFDSARQQIQQIHDSVDRINQNKSQLSGTIRVAVERDTVSHVLPTALAGFKSEYPRLTIELVTSSFGEIDALLLGNEVDFALMVLYEKKEHFSSVPFTRFSRTLSVDKSIIAKFGEPEALVDITQYGFVGYYSAFGDLRFWMQKNGYSKYLSEMEKILAVTVVNDAYTLNEMVHSGMGAGLVFDAIASARKRSHLVPIFANSKPMIVTVDLAYRAVRNESYIQQCFRHYMTQYGNELIR
jgi:DNA-binding transcriptional LysR family regulator